MKTINPHYVLEHYYFKDDGVFPNSHYPALVYRNVLKFPRLTPGSRYVRTLFNENGWESAWEEGVFTFDHYHSNTHEALGIIKGETRLRLGGDNGGEISVRKGDVVIIPAGVAHRNLGAERAIICIGAYPNGCTYDMQFGKSGERPATDKNIRRVAFPGSDPVLGTSEGVINFWKEPAEKSK
jgi:uncharacterized protein YjlB